jgi:diamine N-acetyltransferase
MGAEIDNKDPMPEAGSPVSLREVTADTVRAVTRLAVSPEQTSYVAGNAVSIAQAYFDRSAWFRAVYAGEVPVGFVMIEDQTLLEGEARPAEPEVGLWRFMIDRRAQGRGFGAEAIALLVAHVATRPGIHQLWCSCVPGPHSPRAFYEKLGFVATGAVDDGEEVLLLDLKPLVGNPNPA